MELAEQLQELDDPTYFWAYKDEDFVGLVASIGESRGGVSNPATTPERIVQRIRILS